MADGFLGRWSRRKQDAREGKPLEEPAAPAPAQATVAPGVALPPASAAAAPLAAGVPDASSSDAGQPRAAEATEALPSLADAQQLTPESDFKPFVARNVAPEVRNLAMKKLFADPHFNVMDGLDIYIGDYSQPDPMPAGMLRKMVSAHTMGFFDHEKKQDEAAMPAPGGLQASAAPADGAAAGPRDDAGVQTDPDVAQLPAANAAPSVSLSPPDPATASTPEPLARSASHTRHDDQDAHLRL
ncbi:DUF3306 domain-containing protein [Acidovorax sp.]|uniref:DUF3306 domain-containing protein n=1 Tax=Acidovorax sp. TaxID=1872122 RepID=UPI00391F6F1B